MIGLSIGNYKILEQLNGTETFGVYKAVDMLLNRHVYIKVPVRELMNQPDIVENFRFEAATLAKLVHPNVPTLHSLTTVNERMFIITEFLEGETLDRLLQKQGRISSEKAILIFKQIFDCLEFAHSAGISHGDLKADNIFLTENDDIKILGFGRSENFPNHTNSNNPLPEVPSNGKSDESKDIYAVGKLLFEALTGENLNSGTIQETEQRLREVKPVIPEKIVEIIINIFRLKSYGKYQSAFDLKREFLAAELYTGNSAKVSAEIIKKEFLGRSGNNNTAEYSVDFSQDKRKFFNRAFRRKLSNDSDTGKTPIEASVNWKLAQKNVWVGGAGILAIVALHFFFQFSSVNNEAVQMVKDLNQTKVAAEFNQTVETEQDKKVESLPDIDPFTKQIGEKIDESELNNEVKSKAKSKKPEFAGKPEIVTPSIQLRQKPSPSRIIIKKKSTQETRAERLRRAEKILTGA